MKVYRRRRIKPFPVRKQETAFGRWKLPSFIRRHVRAQQKKKSRLWISFIGTFILVATFVTKEELRERWKQKSESIENARVMYSIRKDLGDKNVFDAENRLELQRIETLLNHQPLNSLRSFSSDLKYDTMYVDFDIADLQNLALIVERLPKQDRNHRDLEEYLQTDLGMKIDGERIAREISTITLPKDPKDRAKSAAFDLEVEIGGYEKGVDEIRANSSSLADDVMKDADAFKTKTEALSKWAEWGSVSLYIVGAIFGLYGKLSGAGESSAE